MSIAVHALAETPIADAGNAAPTKAPPKRRTTAFAEPALVPEAR